MNRPPINWDLVNKVFQEYGIGSFRRIIRFIPKDRR